MAGENRHPRGDDRMKVKLMIYGFKSWLGPIGMNTVVDTIEGEVTREDLTEIKKKIKTASSEG